MHRCFPGEPGALCRGRLDLRLQRELVCHPPHLCACGKERVGCFPHVEPEPLSVHIVDVDLECLLLLPCAHVPFHNRHPLCIALPFELQQW